MRDVVLSIDPGLAQWGWAIWDATDLPPKAQRGFNQETLDGRLMAHGSSQTSPGHNLVERHRKILRDLDEVVRRCGDRGNIRVVIERPAAGGTAYQRNRDHKGPGATQAGVSSVMMVAGLMFGYVAGLGLRVDWIAADNRKKPERWALVTAAVGSLRGVRTNKEKRDAIYYGAKVLADSRR